MESVFMDNNNNNNNNKAAAAVAAMSMNNNLRSSVSSLNLKTMYGGGYNYNSLHHISQLFLNYPNSSPRYPVSLLHPPPLYSSLPSHQPPLLPLPLKSATLPSTTRKIGITHSPSKNISNSNSQKNRKRKNKKKESKKQIMRPIMITTSPPEKEPEANLKPEEETEEEFLIVPSSSSTVGDTSVNYYSVSPPPASSLPFPRLLLMRLRQPIKSRCVAEAMADSGEADDFCRLLRL